MLFVAVVPPRRERDVLEFCTTDMDFLQFSNPKIICPPRI